MAILTAERLREVLTYNPETGAFARLTNKRHPGGMNTNGYIRIQIDGRLYYAHRLAWLYVTGNWPLNKIDHIDHNRVNNKFANLRDVSDISNAQNQIKARSDSVTGLIGSSPQRKGKFVSHITVNGKCIHLGIFESAIEGHNAYIAAKRQLHEGNTL